MGGGGMMPDPTTRAGRYTPIVANPELIQKAREAGISLREMKARYMEGHWFVSGYDGRGALRMYAPGHNGDWQRIA